MLKLIWLIPILPLFGVAINGLFGRRLGRKTVGLIGCGVVLLALLLSAGAVLELSRLPEDARHF
jgi:NADH-quinone oxidoreductase subunit L